jgi:hypothetical protein
MDKIDKIDKAVLSREAHLSVAKRPFIGRIAALSRIALLLLILPVFQACELESVRYDAINTTIFPQTAADAEALVTGTCYYNFQGGWEYLYDPANGLLPVNDMASDISETGWRWHDVLIYGRWSLASTNSNIDNKWQGVKRISGMTLAIDRISQIDMDETHKNRLIAEVHVGRAYLTLLMYDYYGPVPIADLETLKNPLEEKILPRATEEEMQKFIEDDLLAAVNAPELPYVYKKGDAEYGRFCKGFGYMLLLKFYMQTRQWAKAEAAGRELMKPEYGYGLVPRYKDIFTLANEKNEETIYSYNAQTDNRGHAWQAEVLPSDCQPNPSVTMSGLGAHKLAWWFMDTYEPGDQRLEVIISEYVGTGGTVHNKENDITSNNTLRYGAVPLKYEVEATNSGWWCQIDYILYRYADALTLLSEAIVRKNNVVTQEAIDLLNRVRTRAGLKAYTAASFTGPRDFLDKLLMERAHELFWENCRRQDLVRDGSYVEAMRKKCQIAGEVTLVKEGYERFPIPQSVIDEGKGVILQNPGY